MSIRKPPSRSMSAITDAIATSSAAERGREAAAVARKLVRSAGKAAWILGTTFLVLGLPLVIALEREASINELIKIEQDEMQNLLGTAS